MARAIEIGNAQSVLQLPKAALRNPGQWTQLDSDILAHLIQVQRQIHQSRWNKSEVRFHLKGPNLEDTAFPEFEDYVYAAVYLRQLIGKRDGLLADAANRYCRFVDCQFRPSWLEHELDSFNRTLCEEAWPVANCTVRQLFDAFIYGAALLHKIPEVNDATRKRFLRIYDEQPRHAVLYALHASLKSLMNHVNSAVLVIYRDYSHWLHDYNLPRPDTRWHEGLFDVRRDG